MSDQATEAAIQYAKKYLEDILSFFGLNTDVYASTEDGEVIELDIPSTHLNGFLIGQRGETMRSLQFLVSNALKRIPLTAGFFSASGTDIGCGWSKQTLISRSPQ